MFFKIKLFSFISVLNLILVGKFKKKKFLLQRDVEKFMVQNIQQKLQSKGSYGAKFKILVLYSKLF